MNVALPPYLLLIPFAIVFVVVVFFSLVNITHVLRYGASGAVGFLTTFLYIAVTSCIVFITIQHLPDMDWTSPMRILNTMSLASPF